MLISQLPPGLKELAAKRQREETDKRFYPDSFFLHMAFNMSKSPEGLEFWKQIGLGNFSVYYGCKVVNCKKKAFPVIKAGELVRKLGLAEGGKAVQDSGACEKYVLVQWDGRGQTWCKKALLGPAEPYMLEALKLEALAEPEPLKLEVWKTYVDREGRLYKIIGISLFNPKWPYIGAPMAVDSGSRSQFYKEDGSWGRYPQLKSKYDLIKEVKP